MFTKNRIRARRQVEPIPGGQLKEACMGPEACPRDKWQLGYYGGKWDYTIFLSVLIYSSRRSKKALANRYCKDNFDNEITFYFKILQKETYLL